MDHIQVELKKIRFFAYLFDGKEESAKKFCQKWGGTYIMEPTNTELTFIRFSNGNTCRAGNYVVSDGRNFSTYTQHDFNDTFQVVGKYGHRDYSFFSED